MSYELINRTDSKINIRVSNLTFHSLAEEANIEVKANRLQLLVSQRKAHKMAAIIEDRIEQKSLEYSEEIQQLFNFLVEGSFYAIR